VATAIEFDEVNADLWDGWAELNVTSHAEGYDVEAFRKGGTTLRVVEREALGDVAGKRILHMQCHFGLDTLSLARLGAIVTGVDYSPKCIDFARSLSEELSIPATFVRSNIYDLPDVLDGKFDVVFTSY
jgi:2-polyprenyl-3-methyl-5-hydroxy-6-metoxy-1,4-benzoquinol methylase